MLEEAEFYEKIDENSHTLQCNLCGRHCKIADKQFGFCKSRKNVKGEMRLVNYSKIASYHKDPIEKKPLYHFLPGTNTFSIGGFGCNFTCLNCQNYMLARNSYEFTNTIKIMPEAIVKTAFDSNCRSISWTYNESSLYFEFAKKTAELSRAIFSKQQENKLLKNIFVTNGYMSEEACEDMVTFIDAFNIDLKSFSDKFYKEICGGGLDLVLDNLKTVYKTKNDLNNGLGPHLEITTLLIGDLNTSREEIQQLCEFVYYELGKEVPLHFSRFFPQYKMQDIPATDTLFLERAKKIAKDVGLEYVYLGNMPSDNNSYCPNCGELLVERNGFSAKGKKRIKDGRCLTCGHELNFIFE